MAVEYPHTDPWWSCPIDEGWSIGALLDGAAMRHHARPALWTEGHGALTHGEVRDRASRVRGALLAAAPAGSRTVACLASMDAPLYVGLHAVLTSGLAYAALEPDSPAARNRMCLEDCGAEVILTDSGSLERAEALAEGKRRIVMIEEAIARGVPHAPAAIDPASPAAFVFTSGSTGRPKAVVRSQRSLARAMYCFAENLGYGPDDVMLYPGSPGHIGSLNDALTCMTTGFKSIPIDIARVDLTKVCQTLVEHRVTRMPMPPSLLRLLLRLMAEVRDDLCLKTVVASGEALLRSDVGLFYEVMGDRAVLWQNYGSTETGPIAAGKYTAKDAEGQGPLPLRRVHLGGQLEVVDSHGKVVPDGESGEFRVRSNFLANGYMNAPPEQMAKFGMDDRGRFFNIGDRGHRTLQGEYFIAGRGDRQIKLHGRRIELGDVESAIMTHREWAEAVVVQTSGNGHGPSLIAVLRAMPGADADVLRLRSQLATRLPEAAIPRKFRVVDQMPRTTTGKLDLGAVAKLAAQSAEVASIGHGGPPLGTTENWIADTWQYILRIERPGREDRFQDVGGDSLAAIDLSLALEKRFGISVGLDRIAESQTIARLAEVVQRGDAQDREPLVRLRSDGHGPVCIMIPGIGGHAWVFAELARALHQPCDVLGLSLCDLIARGGNLRDAVRQEVLRAASDAGHRPVVIGGYSFGGMIAADCAAWLIARGLGVERVLLIDPSPVSSAPSPSRRPSLRSMAQRFKAKVFANGNGNGHARSAAAEQIERTVEDVTRELRNCYMDGSVVLPNIETAWIASAQMARKHAGVSRVFGRDAATLKRTEVPVGHLEVIRVPGVYDTAAWMDEQLLFPSQAMT